MSLQQTIQEAIEEKAEGAHGRAESDDGDSVAPQVGSSELLMPGSYLQC